MNTENLKKITELAAPMHAKYEDANSQDILLSRLFWASDQIADDKLSEILDNIEDIKAYLQMLALPFIAENIRAVRIRQTIVDIAICSDTPVKDILCFLSAVFQHSLSLANGE